MKNVNVKDIRRVVREELEKLTEAAPQLHAAVAGEAEKLLAKMNDQVQLLDALQTNRGNNLPPEVSKRIRDLLDAWLDAKKALAGGSKPAAKRAPGEFTPAVVGYNIRRESVELSNESFERYIAATYGPKNEHKIGLDEEGDDDLDEDGMAMGYSSGSGSELEEKAPPGWKGTVKAMKKHKGIKNPFALAWSMKKKGATPHKKNKG